MEEKQLNFDKPLLSVRRFTTAAALENDGKNKNDRSVPDMPQPPRYKSELKSGPVRNPGTVPFVWEQSPGRPKDKSKPRTQTVQQPPTAPKLPPGRVLKANQQDTDNVYPKPSANRNQAGNVSHGSWNSPPLDEEIRNCDTPKDTKEEEEKSSSEDGDEAYVDALDTLSRTESFFINCSISGISWLEDADTKTSRNSAMDPQTRDLMMGRFLPAAKAVASETPQHAPRKPPIILEQPRQLKKVTDGNKKPQLRYGPSFVHSQTHDSRDEESDDDYDEQEIFPSKVCGLLPCLGFKSSFCLLNPLPGMSVRTRVPMSPLSKTQQYQSDMSTQRLACGLQTTKPQMDRNYRRNEGNQTFSQSNYKKREGTSPYRQLEAGGVLSNGGASPLSYEQSADISIPEEANNLEAAGSEQGTRVLQSFQEFLANQNGSKELDIGSPVAEKTLYVDTVHKVEFLDMNFSPLNTKNSDIREKEYEMHTERVKQNPIIVSSIEDIDKLSIAMSQPHIQKPVEFHVRSSGHKVNQDSVISASLKVAQEESTQNACSEAEKLENHLEFPAPPPLPKSPTDSWLGRTLPSMFAKNASIHSYLRIGDTPKYQASTRKSSDPKWETIVKKTKTQHQYMRFSEERLTPIPEA